MTLFVDCFFVIIVIHEVGIVVTITPSSFKVFFPRAGKSLSKTFYLREIENVVDSGKK